MFIRVAVAIIDQYYGDPSSELTFLGKIFCAISSGASLISFSGSSHTLVDFYKEYLGSGRTKILVDDPTFDNRFLKQCLQKTASVVFRTLDPFSTTEFIVTRLKEVEQRDRMQSRQSLRMALKTCNLSFSGLLDVVSIITGDVAIFCLSLKGDSGDTLVVGHHFLVFYFT